MSLLLYCHPLASFCWKVLIALYENGTPFEKVIVDLGDPASRATFAALWPLAKFPVLKDQERGELVPESSIIIEYLAQHHPGTVALVPADPDLARKARLGDRFYDHYVHQPMQTIVFDKLRPAGKKDSHGVEQARATLSTAYSMIEAEMAQKVWAVGGAFTMADCAALPALYYANRNHPLGAEHPNARAYLDRLLARESVMRVLREAEPYMHMVPA